LNSTGVMFLDSFSFISPIQTPGNSDGWRVFDTKWDIPTIKWYIDSEAVILYDEVIVQKAFNEWGKYIDLNFKRADNKDEAQILIVELSNDEPFECPGLNIRHAAGMMCPDEGALFEVKKLNENNRINIFLNSFDIATSDEPNVSQGVLLHEIGYAIGVSHPGLVFDASSMGGRNDCAESVMAQGSSFFSELQPCDI